MNSHYKLIIGLLVIGLAGCNQTKPQDEIPQTATTANCIDQKSCISLVKQRIGSNWRIPRSYKEGMWAKVEIRIDHENNVYGVFFLNNRGDRRFAESIERAILKSSPLTSLNGIKDDDGKPLSRLEITFNPNPDFQSDNPAHEVYQQGFDLIKLKRYEEAISQFKKVRREYPQTKYARNSLYWLGELYLSDGELAEAQHYFELISNSKSNPKRADALYKLGRIMELEGNTERAKRYYFKVINEYEGSVISKLAAKQVSRLE